MHKLLAACIAAVAVATPALAWPADDEDSSHVAARNLPGNLPSSRDIEAAAPALDRMMGALLEVDVGPMMDAVDPYRRHPGYGRPGRSLGALGRHDDPEFDRRWRGALYGSTAQLGAMMDGLAAAAPALRRSLREVENGIAAAVGEYRARRADPRADRDYEDDPFED